MTSRPHYDFVYVSSYNECDVALLQGLDAAFRKLRLRFAVVGYTSTYVAELIHATGVEFFNLRQPGPLRELREENWQALEERTGQPIGDFVFPEQRYYMTSREKLAARALALLDGFDVLLERVSIGAFLHKLGAELVRRTAMVAAEQHRIETIFLGTFPAQFVGRTFLHHHFWSERDDPSLPAPNVGDTVSKNSFARLLDDVRERRQVIHYPLQGTRRWAEAPRMLWSMVRHGEAEFVADILSRKVEIQKFRLRNVAAGFLATKSLPKEPFYFFPLHVFDDSQITVRNPQFYDQSWIIEMIERALPAGMRLVVKMHPGLDGAVPLSFLRKMTRLKRVHLLDGRCNAHDVIRRCEGVIAINSTVGLEALIHAKPVYILGHWTFGNLGLTRQLTDYRELPRDLLSLRSDHVDPERVVQVLYDLYGEMARFSYNREPIDYEAMAHALATMRGTELAEVASR